MERLHIRRIKKEVIEKMRNYLIETYGTFYGREGEFISNAITYYLSSLRKVQQQHHLANLQHLSPHLQPRSIPSTVVKLRNDVAVKTEMIKQYLTNNQIERLSFLDLQRRIREVIGNKDVRTANKYVAILIRTNFIRAKGSLYEITGSDQASALSKGVDQEQDQEQEGPSVTEPNLPTISPLRCPYAETCGYHGVFLNPVEFREHLDQYHPKLDQSNMVEQNQEAVN
jgi:hypothetical protein